MIKTWKYLAIIALTYFAIPQSSEAANILAFLPSSSPSHLIIEMAVVRSMVERQHNVTVVSVLPLKSEWLHDNMTHIKLDKGLFNMDSLISVTNLKGFEKFRKSIDMSRMITSQMALIFEDSKFQELLNNPSNKFDLMIFGYFFGEYFFGIAEHFDCPMALVWPNIPTAYILNLIGCPLEISYTTLTLLNPITDDAKGFVFRLKNVVAVTAELLLLKNLERKTRQIYNENFPPEKYVNYDKAKQRVALVLFSHHFSEKPIRPLVPALIEIGGIHINDEPKALTQDLEDFISSAKHGVIFFSMGTNIKEYHMQPHALNKIYNVLSKMKQKVLWKVDDEFKVPGNSSNILYRKWLPQADIIGHANIKLFFGHGGKGGITEAKFYGVPIVGLPIFAEQPMNMEEVVKSGYGLSIDHDKPLTEEIISKTILEVLQNPFYANNVKRFSALYRDRPIKAKDNAVYWLEYLLRYKGAPHIQSPLKTMSFVEAVNLDIIVFILIVLFLVFKIIKFLCKIVIKLMGRAIEIRPKRD